MKVKLTVLLKIPEVSFEGPAQIPQCHSHGCPCPNLQCLQFHPQGQDNNPWQELHPAKHPCILVKAVKKSVSVGQWRKYADVCQTTCRSQ